MKFSLNEVLDMAIAVEKSGYDFYIQAAKKLIKYSEFFNYLATEELGHDSVFSDIKKSAISSEEIQSINDPDSIIPIYFESMAGSTIFKKVNEIEELFNNMKSIEDVIDWAIKREHDTILFFTGLKSGLVESKDIEIVDNIILEEINHVHILMNKKSELLL